MAEPTIHDIIKLFQIQVDNITRIGTILQEHQITLETIKDILTEEQLERFNTLYQARLQSADINPSSN
jgi:hypothetical protein